MIHNIFENWQINFQQPTGAQLAQALKEFDELKAELERIKALELKAYLVETENDVMLWPADDYDEALTYCDDDQFPVPLYTLEKP